MSASDLEVGEALRLALTGHGLVVGSSDGWFRTDDNEAMIRARISRETEHPDQRIVQLEIDVALPDGRLINECFAGWAPTRRDAELDAFKNFLSSSAHVLLSAIWGTKCSDQVDTEVWQVAGRTWRATLGPYVVRSKHDPTTLAPRTLIGDLTRIAQESLREPRVTWFRHFYCNVGNGTTQAEALRDGDFFTSGEDALRSTAWAHLDEFWSLRHFMIVQPA